ncbi:hypothetical protein [Streptomyces sp. NBC_00932]|uniref:hypothetical protein n=1 Tax=Streptomyces sp. NBC_00932 TaxID=2903690 RepID=UPI00386E429A|nr:hypothetical protein OG221_27870 [Streptomyces sp. NBC_00932]
MPIPGNMLSSVTEMVDPNTSGWTSKLNATISLGTGGRNGDGCLSIKSVASGEMQARTVSSYPVAAGTVYQVFADASGATVPERIGIRWLSAANAEVGVTWSLTTATASSTWHRIGVAGVAPVGCTRAQVVVSAAPAAANVVTFVENVYLGLPVSTTGNLLDFNAETMEIDASGWAVESNCTLARTVPANQWPVDYYLGGGHLLTVTVTTAGNASAKLAAPAVATPGVEYVAYCHIGPPASAAAAWTELRFLDAGGTVLLAARSQLAAPGTGLYRQIASGIAPTGTVAAVLAVGITSGTAGQVVRLDNAVVAALADVAAAHAIYSASTDSVLPFADSNFEQGLAGWVKASGVATIARSTPWGAHAFGNGYSMALTSSTSTTSVINSAPFPLGPNPQSQPWAAPIAVTVGSGGWTLTMGVTWYDSTGTPISTSTSAGEPIPGTGWWIVTASATAPTGAASGSIQISALASAASSVLYLDSAALYQALPLTEASVGEDTASVAVTIRDLNPGDTMTLWRVTADGARTLVRGPSGLLDSVPVTSDTVFVEDYEAPLGTPVHYYLETRSASGALTRSSTWDTVIVPVADDSLAWLKDPGNPQRNLQVVVQTPPDWTRPIDQSPYVVKNRRNKVTLSGRRQGLEGDLAIWTRSDGERAQLHWLLDSGNVILWQAAPGLGVNDMYVTVGEAPESRIGGPASEVWRSWTLPLTEADMPVTTGVNGSAGRTWRDILTEFDTWEDVLSAFATWEDVLLNRRMEG